jgi:predicted O-methyltransferase YrrM
MSERFEAVWSELSGVEGWMTEGQGRMLWDCATRVADDQAIVEIGSHRGRSTIVLAKAKRSRVQLFAVDPFDDPRWGGGTDSLGVFEANLKNAGVRDAVEHIRGFGADAARDWAGPAVAMLYVDGAHDYPTVRREIEAWTPHLTPGAAMLFHDAFSSPGVTRAILTTLGVLDRIHLCGRSRSLALFYKRPVGSR